ncbi:hypothetical protein Tco_0600094 [Tanacetum coccineum]|uniref:Uncharacterized protein n=1 Tax=Tanacetum coccineum TaxID=301880 RepID=A0ABQ4WAX1_9ASTR
MSGSGGEKASDEVSTACLKGKEDVLRRRSRKVNRKSILKVEALKKSLEKDLVTRQGMKRKERAMDRAMDSKSKSLLKKKGLLKRLWKKRLLHKRKGKKLLKNLEQRERTSIPRKRNGRDKVRKIRGERTQRIFRHLAKRRSYYKVSPVGGRIVQKNYKVLSEMLEDFDRLDVEELYRLVKNRYSASSPEGFDLMLWGDLHTLFEPDKDDEIWRDQHEYNLLSWRLCDFCGIHILLMDNGLAIHMLTEKEVSLKPRDVDKDVK